MTFLGLCGSLRSQSLSAALLRAAQSLAPTGVDIQTFDRLGQLPLFNPELEPDAPEPVIALRDAVTTADAIVIVSPEYAHGVTGTMKNTLDWLVSHIPFAYKPVAVLNPALGAHHADAALKEILRTMSADLIDGACIRIPVIGSGVSAEHIADTPVFATALKDALQAMSRHVADRSSSRAAASQI